MKTKQFVTMSVVIFFSGAVLIGSATAADAKQGEAKSMVCAGCHGGNGISVSPDVPNLAGQKEMYLAKAIAYYKSGERKNPMMSSMVGGLSDADMANLAAYYSSLKP